MIPKKLKNFTAFVDGVGYAGRVEEIEPVKFKLKTEEYRGGGMDAAIDIDMGMEKLETTLTFAEYTPELFMQLGLVDGADVPLTLRGAIQGTGEAEEVIYQVRGLFHELDSGTWKAGDNSTLKASVTCTYVKLTISGREVIEIDVENMVRKIGGVDQLAGQRQALGL